MNRRQEKNLNLTSGGPAVLGAIEQHSGVAFPPPGHVHQQDSWGGIWVTSAVLRSEKHLIFFMI